MGMDLYKLENYLQAGPAIDWQGITPVKTEPIIFRAIQELISAQLFTQQLLTQQAMLGGKTAGRSFIRNTQRADEGMAYDDAADHIQVLTQRIEELERRLEGSSSS